MKEKVRIILLSLIKTLVSLTILSGIIYAASGEGFFIRLLEDPEMLSSCVLPLLRSAEIWGISLGALALSGALLGILAGRRAGERALEGKKASPLLGQGSPLPVVPACCAGMPLLFILGVYLRFIPVMFRPEEIISFILPVLTILVCLMRPVSVPVRLAVYHAMTSEDSRLKKNSGMATGRIYKTNVRRIACLSLLDSLVKILPWLVLCEAVLEFIYGIPGICRMFITSLQRLSLDSVYSALIALSAGILVIGFALSAIRGFICPVPLYVEELYARYEKKSGLFPIALFILLLILVGGIAGGVLGLDPFAANASERFLMPGPSHLFGTDDMGRDYLARVLDAVQNTSLAALLSGAAMSFFALLLSTLIRRGKAFGRVLLFILEAASALPLAFLLFLIRGMSGSIYALAICLSAAGAAEAAVFYQRTGGNGEGMKGKTKRQLRRIGSLLVRQLIIAVLLESTLSFLGIGAPAAYPTLSVLIAYGKMNLIMHPHLTFIPAAVAVLLTSCLAGMWKALAGQGQDGKEEEEDKAAVFAGKEAPDGNAS